MRLGAVTNEINNNHPYMSNIAGHARVVRGYYYDTERPWIKYQRINDPWPVGQGEDRWENLLHSGGVVFDHCASLASSHLSFLKGRLVMFEMGKADEKRC